MRNKVIILGGNGFIGRNIVQQMVRDGKEVTVLDRTIPYQKNPRVNYVVGNCEDSKLINEVFKGQEVVIHLANSILPQSSMSNPVFGYKSEVVSIINIIEACRHYSIKRVIFASSGGTVYGDNGMKLNTEDSSTHPINHYGIVKLTIENILLMYNTLYNMENIILRIANPYGAGQNVSQGVGAVTVFANKLLKGEEITIFGDGNTVRDYVGIEDVVQGFCLACKWEHEDIKPIFNIGSGKGISLNQALQWIGSALGITPCIKYEPKRDFDVLYNVLDINKSFRYLDYYPKVQPEEGIREYVSILHHDFNK